MASDPEPGELVSVSESNGAVGAPNVNGPYLAFLLKPQGRVKRVLHEELVLLNGKVLHFGGEL
jgi:hypothetical protein